TKLIVEVDRADAARNLPRTPATTRQRERMVRHDAEVGCRGRIVLAGLASQDEARLCIAAFELQVRRSERRESGHCIAIDIEPEIFSLEKQRPIRSGGLDTVDLCAGNVCHRAG